MFVFFRNGERTEVPEAISTRLDNGLFLCLDSSGKVVGQYPVESVVMFAAEPWDSCWMRYGVGMRNQKTHLLRLRSTRHAEPNTPPEHTGQSATQNQTAAPDSLGNPTDWGVVAASRETRAGVTARA